MLKSKKFVVVLPLASIALFLCLSQSRAASGPVGDETIDKAASAIAGAVADTSGEDTDAIAQFFRDSASSRYVMTQTDEGKQILSQLTEQPLSRLNSRTAYNSFLDRISWSSNGSIRNELYQRLRQIDQDFLRFRKEEGLDGDLRANESLSAAEIGFLRKQAAAALKAEDFQSLFDHTQDFVSIPKGYDEARAEFEGSGAGAASVLSDPAVIKSSGWLARLRTRFRAVDGFFRFLRFSDGDWRTLLGLQGHQFSVSDVRLIRKLNRLMETLNEYAKTRLTIQAFTMERPALYNELNQMTATDTEKFMNGEMGEKAYLQARAAAAKQLQMNDVVNQAETRMVHAIDEAKRLGGTAAGDEGLIPAKEAEVRVEERKMNDASARIDSARQAIAEAKSAGERASAQKKLELAISDRDLSANRIASASAQLRDFYWQFVNAYEPLDIFANLRQGLLNSDPVPAFNLPDSMAVDPSDVAKWSEIYDRALSNSTGKIILNESREFFAGKAYATRKFISDLNNATGKWFGTRFTDSQYGAEFKAYSQGVVKKLLVRMVTYVGGPAVAASVVDHKMVNLYFNRFWNFFFLPTQAHSPSPSQPPAPASASVSAPRARLGSVRLPK